MVITENELDQWVRGHSASAQRVVVELVWRLVSASSPNPQFRRFPLDIGQHGPDGELDAIVAFDPFVPEGRSFWEIGTNNRAGAKATDDYSSLTEATPEPVKRASTFVFVTPLSGRRDWEYSWKEEAQASWLESRQASNDWADVRVIDGAGLIDWLHHFPAVESWLLGKMNIPSDAIDTPQNNWNLIKTIGEPPTLIPDVFLANREGACEQIYPVFSGVAQQLRLECHFPEQVVDFVSAYIENLEPEASAEVAGRCLIISSIDAVNTIIRIKLSRHVLVFHPSVDVTGQDGVKLLQRIRNAGHAVIFSGTQGGVPHPNREALPQPRIAQVQAALEKAGYNEQRAIAISQKCGGNLNSLLRILQNASVIPGWAGQDTAAELVIAQFLGSWDEGRPADVAIAEKLAGKPYGEWIEKVREIARRPGTPLTLRDGVWKFVSRYEGWNVLGVAVHDDLLMRFKDVLIEVLGEFNPKFELDADQRYAASIYGKTRAHSQALRSGLSDTLALLGSLPSALTSCTRGRAEATAASAVQALLESSGWRNWAGLNDQLPLLAEAAPSTFMSAVDTAIRSQPCPFDAMFAEEKPGLMGENYMTGVLWALESLAWDEAFLGRATTLLADLAARDPGGNWGNRPENSLSTILLPWLPQTCASIDRRVAAVQVILRDQPAVGWSLLLKLLPQGHSTSSGTRRPAWRNTIPDEWRNVVTTKEFWEQTLPYVEMAVAEARADVNKLVALIDRVEDLPLDAFGKVVEHLSSDAVRAIPEDDRVGLWEKLIAVVIKHRKFSDADWAMESSQLDRLEGVANAIMPDSLFFTSQRFFSERDFDLYSEKGSYEEQGKELDSKRQDAVRSIYSSGGIQELLRFLNRIDSPWRLGLAFGEIADESVDRQVFPFFDGVHERPVIQFSQAYALARFRKLGIGWVKSFGITSFDTDRQGDFLACLPFVPEVWAMVGELMGDNQASYWTKTAAQPYEAKESLGFAIDCLIKYERRNAAIHCAYVMGHFGNEAPAELITRVLLSESGQFDTVGALSSYEITELIGKLQADPQVEEGDLLKVEMAYLPLLDRMGKASPVTLEKKLASDPSFFCEAVRLVFLSDIEAESKPNRTEREAKLASAVYQLLHHWKIPPGLSGDGKYDGEVMSGWLSAVVEECRNTGHLEVAMVLVGEVMTCVPPDPDGLWIDRAAASALNGRSADSMRSGFRTRLFNSRGVHGYSAGRDELALAERYQRQADDLDKAGFQNFSAALRGLADSYRKDAERDSMRSPFDD